MRATITMVLVCHDDPKLYKEFQERYAAWTRKPDEVIELGSVQLSPKTLVRPDFKDKGYDKRAVGLEKATKDWIIFVNYDNEHEPDMLEKCEAAIHSDTLLVWFRANGKYYPHCPATAFTPYNSGMDNFMVRTEIMRQVGIREHVGGYCDGNTSNPPDAKIVGALNTLIPDENMEFIPEFLLRIN